MRGKELASTEFNRVMNIDAFVSDYEFMNQLYQLNIIFEDVKKAVKRK
jgi:hypothetical protein